MLKSNDFPSKQLKCINYTFIVRIKFICKRFISFWVTFIISCRAIHNMDITWNNLKGWNIVVPCFPSCINSDFFNFLAPSGWKIVCSFLKSSFTIILTKFSNSSKRNSSLFPILSVAYRIKKKVWILKPTTSVNSGLLND